MLIAVILGNRLEDDGGITEIMEKRLKSAVEIDRIFSPDRIIVSGGVANKKAEISEAEKMLEYLVENGVSKEKIIKEDKSLTTEQNALYSVPIAAQLGASELLLCTSYEHLTRKYLNPAVLFQRQLASFPDIRLKIYCED